MTKSIWILTVSLLMTPSAWAQQIAADDLQELRDLVRKQQQTIERLERNQALQASDISELQRRLAEPPGSGAGLDSGTTTRQGPVVALSLDDKTRRGEAGASTDPSSLLKTPVVTSGKAISIGAHVNRAVNVVDDGASSEAYFVDNGNYPSLFYIKGYKQVDDWNIGGHVEFAVQQNPAILVAQDNQDAGFNPSARFFELTFDHARYGKVWFGRGFMSSFIAVEADKSETWRFNLLSVGNSFGGMKFVDANDNSLSDVTVRDVFLDTEAFSLRDRVRYDSPIWGGAQVSASVGSGDSADVTLRWNGQLGDFSVFAGGSAQTNPVVGRIDDRYDGAIGLVHESTGFSFSAGAVRQKYKREFFEQFGRADGDNDGWTARTGIRRNWHRAGESRFAIDYSTGHDILYESDKTESFGVFFSQMFDGLNMELYTGYRYYDYKPGPNANGLVLRDINAFTLGARIGFDATVSD